MASTPGNVHLSITRANAKIYIARILGGAKNQDILAMAEEALLRGFNDWQTEKDWEFLLKDNTGSFTVETVVLANGVALISAPVASAFDGVNVGITVSGSGIPANTTVSSYTRNADGSIATITLSAAPSSPTSPATLTFGGTLPIVAGTSDYNLPTDFHKHYGIRLYSAVHRELTFIRPRDWNRTTINHETNGTVEGFTIYNANSAGTQNKGTYRLRTYRTPTSADIALLQYYRRFDSLADPIDMDGQYLYKFLDYCRGLALNAKRAFDDPTTFFSDTINSLQKAKSSDEEVTEDEEIRMKSQMEMYIDRPALWNNGDFDRYYGGN